MGKLRVFEIVFDNGKSVYNPSELVNGKCIVDLRGDMKMKTLRILMRGVAKRQVLFGSETGDGREVLTEGRHEFHFSFQLPSGGISTSFEGKYGSIRYWLKAEMEKPWTFNHKAKKAFTVICPIDINRAEYLVPVENNMEKVLCCWCCTSGPISLFMLELTEKDIALGNPLPSLQILRIFLVVPLYLMQLFIRHKLLAGGKSRTRHSKYTIVTGLAIQPGRTTSWDAQLLKIPAVTPSIINCCLIRVDYAVRISLQIPGAYNLSMDLPVLIGTVPLRPSNYRHLAPVLDNVSELTENSMYFQPAPPYSELDMSAIPMERMYSPTYAECVEGSVDIADDDDDNIVGDTRFTPMYAYVHSYHHQPPPAYSERLLCEFNIHFMVVVDDWLEKYGWILFLVLDHLKD
ncbi:arrestin domain-containing protein 3 [Caerostris extrusa]|uniref:Arrestin domain-containing protein 3 n=1 Tax=Caerostris extrusa TaxID=172846 RepID=A0AAV4UKJ2_CAEEX|nr:arrestin domain-containing protein 3 [Caerostris extrusa]